MWMADCQARRARRVLSGARHLCLRRWRARTAVGAICGCARRASPSLWVVEVEVVVDEVVLDQVNLGVEVVHRGVEAEGVAREAGL